MEITKTKTTKYKILNVMPDVIEFTKKFKEFRQNYKYQGFECFKCNKHFEIGDKIGLIFTDKGNKTVCIKCAEDIKNDLTTDV